MAVDPRDDAELVEAARRGDRQAFAAIFDRYAPRVHDFCTRRLNEPHTAADATQDTFISAAGKLDQLRDPTRLRAWLYAIARNECTRHGRARARAVPTEDVEVSAAREDAVVGHDDAPAAEAASAEVGTLLWDAAEGLDDKDRELLELHVRHGLEGAELAEAAGVPTGQISMATGRLRERLERSIGALLVARGGRDDCPGLHVVLADWDGTFSVLMRKRVARHIDGCELCGERRTALVAPLGSLALAPMGLAFALPDGALDGVRDRVLAAFDASASSGQPSDPTSPPTAEVPVAPVAVATDTDPVADAPARSRRRLVALIGVVLLLLIGGALAIGSAGDGEPETAASGPGASDQVDAGGDEAATTGEPRSGSTTTPAEGSAPTTTGGTSLANAPASTTLPVGAAPTTRPADVVPETRPPVSVAPAPAPAPTSPPPANQPPSVGATSRSGSSSMQTSCNPANATRTITVIVTDDAGIGSVLLRWSGANSGQKAMTKVGGSTWQATLGPFANPGGVQYRAVATDTAGASSSSPTASVSVDPCPG